MSAPIYFFEDARRGDTFRAGPFVVTREAIIAFAELYDPQPFHLDEVAAKSSLLDGLAASGWQTVAIGMRLFYEALVKDAASMGSPGFDEVRWLKPVRPGDALELTVTIGDTRASSKGDRGFVVMNLELRNGAGEVVMTQSGPVIVQRRDARQTPLAPPHTTTPIAPPPLPAPDLSLAAFYEDLEIGTTSPLGSQHVTAEAIIAFAKAYDPQYFHVDPEAAKASHFGGLIASGWQTAAYWMKHHIGARARAAAAREAAGLPVAVPGPSPGFSKVRWLRPVHAGETIAYAQTITGKYPTSRPGWGLVTSTNTGHAAGGQLAFSFEGRILWPMRG